MLKLVIAILVVEYLIHRFPAQTKAVFDIVEVPVKWLWSKVSGLVAKVIAWLTKPVAILDTTPEAPVAPVVDAAPAPAADSAQAAPAQSAPPAAQ
jgi:hypothetical protein